MHSNGVQRCLAFEVFFASNKSSERRYMYVNKLSMGLGAF
jgi:hypothetical protein